MKKRISSILLVLLLSINFVAIGSVVAQPSEKLRVIIRFNGKADAALIRAYGGDIKHEYNIISAIACSLPEQAIEVLMRNPNIEKIEPDGTVYALEQTLEWGINQIDAELVHPYNTGVGVKVAIIDSGIDYDHEDLDDNYVMGIDYVNDDDDPFDDFGHGTHCAGIIAAEDNGLGVVGVAPDADLYIVKMLDATGSGYESDLIAGIDWAVSQGVQIISMSLGANSATSSLQVACDNAETAGVLLVAAAGNDYRATGRREWDTVDYPGRFDSVIAVGATDINKDKASFSSTGPDVEIAAPGVAIYSTYPDGYATVSGTSMACPHVAGVAALIFASGVESASEVRTILQTTADDLGRDSWYGYGLVDADEATPEPIEDTVPPTISDLTPAEGSLINNVKPLISAKVADPSGIGTITLEVDGEVVTHSFDGSIVSYVPGDELADNDYTVILSVSDSIGNIAMKTWLFTVDTIAPDTVGVLTVTTISSSQLDLAWTAITDATEYIIYRGGLPVGSTVNTVYHDTGLEAGMTYSYTVIAVDEAGNESPSSDMAEGTTDEAPATHEFDALITIEVTLYRSAGKNFFYRATATITVTDTTILGPAQSVTVSGHWEGASSDIDTGITDANGIVILTSDSVKSTEPPAFDFVIDNIV